MVECLRRIRREGIIQVIATLASPGLCATAVLLFSAWLKLNGLGRTVRGFAGGVAAVALITLLIKWLSATPGQTLWPDGALVSQYFPSGHAALAIAVYGSVATALARAGGGAWRYAPFAALALALAVAAARVAARAHPVGDVAGGLAIGLIAPVATYFAMAEEAMPMPGSSKIFLAFAATVFLGWLLPVPLPGLLPL
jgi:undecaprenyl-diphosphatase